MSVPYPDPVVIAVLSSLPGLEALDGRVSTRLDEKAELPALRVTKVRDHEPPTHWEANPIYQVEVWHSDEFKAGSLAWEIKNRWPTARKEVVGEALVTHRWIDLDPFPSPDPETETPRFIVTVGIRLSGATS